MGGYVSQYEWRNRLTYFDKETLRNSIVPKVTSVYKVLKFDPYPHEVLLLDIDQDPPLEVYVKVTPVYFKQVSRWKSGTSIRATIRSEVFTISEKAKEMGWSKKVCEKVLRESGYSWEDALANYYFEGEVEEL
jgi:hypothetical protein